MRQEILGNVVRRTEEEGPGKMTQALAHCDEVEPAGYFADREDAIPPALEVELSR
jgi:hypothetical protein